MIQRERRLIQGLRVVGILVAATVGLATLAAACEGSSKASHSTPPPPPTTPRTLQSACPAPRRTLVGVYDPYRLQVLRPCQYARGTVMVVHNEVDGDLHVLVRLDPAYRALLNAENMSQTTGGLVIEFMPRDAGHLPQPYRGERLGLVGAWVLDTIHGWRELHPVFWVEAGDQVWRSGPQFGGSPPGALSSTAAKACRTQTGSRCHGYAD